MNKRQLTDQLKIYLLQLSLFCIPQKSFGACDRQKTALSSYARAARLSIGTAAAGIGNLFTRKMATATANNLCPWPNSQDDYELRDVIGKFFMKTY